MISLEKLLTCGIGVAFILIMCFFKISQHESNLSTYLKRTLMETEPTTHERCSFHGQWLESTQECWCLALYDGTKCDIEKPHRFRVRQQLIVVKDDLDRPAYKSNIPFSVEEAKSYFPMFDPLMNISYRSCAVVGNGGELLQKNYGSEIDDHDAIFRCNIGPTKGFEENVGKRTTYRFSYPPLCGAAVAQDSRVFPERMPTVVCFYPLNTPLMGKYFFNSHRQSTYVKEEMNRNYKNMREDSMSTIGFYALDSIFEKQVQKIVNVPTTGFTTIQIATQMCDYIDLYGFTMADAWADMDEAKSYHFPSTFTFHYYDSSERVFRDGNPHKYDVEHRELLKMEMKGFIVNRHRKHKFPGNLH